MCGATRSKIELLLRSQTQSTFITFLQAQVGFARHDSSVQLSKSLAGVNFLALAAALVSTTDTFEAGTALECMIEASASDKTLVPTAYHLKDLLDVLEPRLNKAGFFTTVLEWKEWWMSNEGTSVQERSYLVEHGETFPSVAGMQTIVAALRDVHRVGEATNVNFTARRGAPWLTAFIVWCIGTKPTIYDHVGQVLFQSDTHISVIYSNQAAFDREIRVELTHSFDNFVDVLSANLMHMQGENLSHLAAGMTTIPVYARHLLMSASMEDPQGIRYRALMEALPFALDRGRKCCFWAADTSDPYFRVTRGNAFPHKGIIADVMAKYLSLDRPVPLAELERGTRITDQPLVQLVLRHHDRDYNEGNNESDFKKVLTVVVADILALSLFNGSLESMLVYRASGIKPKQEKIYENFLVNLSLTSSALRNAQDVQAKDVVGWALMLAHHEIPTELKNSNWVASSYKGQVVFPKVFEDLLLNKVGYLELFCLPGVLTRAGQGKRSFSNLKGHMSDTLEHHQTSTKMMQTPITKSLNLFPEENLVWQVLSHQDCLSVGMGWSVNTQTLKPFRVLQSLKNALFTEACGHQLDSLLTSSVKNCIFQSPMHRNTKQTMSKNRDNIVLIPVRGHKGLQMLALGALAEQPTAEEVEQAEGDVDSATIERHIIINRGMCLNCLLDGCRTIACTYIIL